MFRVQRFLNETGEGKKSLLSTLEFSHEEKIKKAFLNSSRSQECDFICFANQTTFIPYIFHNQF